MNPFVFLSFDIDSHATEPDQEIQLKRVAELNQIVSEAINLPAAEQPIWASGGDGGHVAFTPAGAMPGTPPLIVKLREWARINSVPVRMLGHFGRASTFRGADGRLQLAGDGINLCGSLLEVVPKDLLTATEAFANFFMEMDSTAFSFHGYRNLYVKHFRVVRVCLCSLSGEPKSNWMALHGVDRQRLRHAVEARAPWDVIYYARRIIQTNYDDEEAKNFITNTVLNKYGALVPSIGGPGFSRFSLFSTMDPPSFLQFVTTSELVERRDGEVLCNQGDPGDTMFIILRGELAVNVLKEADDQRGETSAQFVENLTFGPGDIVGEFAASLKSKRTVTLQAVGNVSLLSFSYQNMRQFDLMHRGNLKFNQAINSFLDVRVLDYLCNHSPYLIGLNRSGPLSGVTQPWEYMHPFSARINLKEGDPIVSSDDRFVIPGLYILASGVLRKDIFEMQAQENIDGTSLCPVYVNFPNKLVNMFGSYTVRSSTATIIHISENGFNQWGAAVRDEIIKGIGVSVAATFEYDVFLSFAVEEYELAAKLKIYLEEERLKVFMDTITPGKQFSQYLGGAIVAALVMVVLVTLTLEQKQKLGLETWVEREVRFRRQAFVGNANLSPLRFGSAAIPQYLEGISYAELRINLDPSSVAEISDLVNEIKVGRVGIPSANPAFSIRMLN
jgi:hypothetical protein